MSGIVINEDCSHFFMDRTAGMLDENGLASMLDHYAAGQVREIFFNPNCMRISCASSAFEPIWHDIEERGDGKLYFRGQPIGAAALDEESAVNWIRAARTLHEKKLNPYRFWLDETRRRGRGAFLSCRMNDLHGADDPDFFLHCDFWRDHPQFYRYRHPNRPAIFWTMRAFDFGCREVREYFLKLLREYLFEYGPDGLELDWMRFGWHFRPGHEDEGRRIMTDFHAEVRSLADTAAKVHGHPIRLAARVPAHIEDAYDLGYDVKSWVDQKSIDWVTPTAFWASTDSEMPIRLWRQLLGPDVTIAAGLELLVRPWLDSDSFRSTAACVFGQAANYLSQGADRLYLFNFMDSRTAMRDRAEYRLVLENAGEVATAAKQQRRCVVTYIDTRPLGRRFGGALPVTAKPVAIQPIWLPNFRWEVGPAPEAGRRVELTIGVAETLPQNPFEAYLNDLPVSFAHLSDVSKEEELEWPENVPAEYRSARQVPNSTATLLHFDATIAVKGGVNVAELKNLSAFPYEITWAELNIAVASGSDGTMKEEK